MKRKIPKDPFNTACWTRGRPGDPVTVFAEVFSYADMAYWRREIKRVVAHAAADKEYRRRAAGALLLDMKVVRSALRAAHALRKARGAEAATAEGEMPRPQDYCCRVGRQDGWGDLPRCLTLKEYCRPYQVFKKLFGRRGLARRVQDWEAVVEAALSPCSTALRPGALRMYTELIKLLEAAHLVWVRG
ncbi:hypothetical protein [Niabella beijingensis]|uniref:hypothetical protein n=1 Tax=Niabella beijingensis TaxID=2872700 RepID=UPI001CBB61B1|nr:hypothetical protein [Niabella beijingensis]MBZ4192155.1 hypothetical protein [Niabella beijingensis]